MLITMLSVGSRGDVQPFLALGVALRKRGHRIRIAAPEGLDGMVEACGLEFATVRGDIASIAASEVAKDAVNADNPLKFVTSLRKPELMSLMVRMQEDLYSACEGSDAIVWHPGAAIGFFAARERRIPSIMASPFPMTPTRAYPSLLFYDRLRLPGPWNRLSHWLFERAFWMVVRGPLEAFWRSRFGAVPKPFSCPFPLQRTRLLPTITSCSPHVFSRAPDLPANAHADGYWFLELESGYQPPAELSRWLEEGPPPVYVGFGSIGERSKAAETTTLVMDAVKKAGMRGLLATGWSGMEAREVSDSDLYFIDAAPHEWLFPRMSVVVHHGGAGTTAAGLKAGIPTVVIPFGNDQFAWGRRVWELGVGARPIPRKRLTSERLAEALLECQQAGVRERAQALGARIREEKGAEKAADVVEDCLLAYHSTAG